MKKLKILFNNFISKLIDLLNKINFSNIIVLVNNKSFPLNSFSIYYHINNFNDYDFPHKTLFKFFFLTSEQWSLAVQPVIDEDGEEVVFMGILLNIRVKSCSTKTIAGYYHEFPFYVALDNYKNQLFISNVPVDLFEEKQNLDLTCYLSKLISDYCIEIETFKYGTSVDLTLEY
uniref:Uncharacterized protein n=1 Tax=Inonotus obliquus TaxID=167356 RepID=A0A5A4U8I1_9AGAM|nr:hypothetical protein [Inonotus obliquus]BBN21297.1 hypothetical protein [Inonotus obliquus]